VRKKSVTKEAFARLSPGTFRRGPDTPHLIVQWRSRHFFTAGFPAPIPDGNVRHRINSRKSRRGRGT
jgi:CDP-diacylglycerol pyrophosphatase